MEMGRCAEGQEEGFNNSGEMERWGEELDGEKGGKWGGSTGKCAGKGKCEKKYDDDNEERMEGWSEQEKKIKEEEQRETYTQKKK